MATGKEREKIITMYEEGKTVKEIVEKTEVPRATVQYTIGKWREKKHNEFESEENIEEEYIGDNEDPHDTPPIDPINSENQIEKTDVPEENSQPQSAVVAEELPDNDAPAEEFPETNKPDYLLGIESLVNVLSEGNKHLVKAIESAAQIEPVVKRNILAAISEFQKTIDQSFLQLNLATETIEEKAKTFEENAALLKDAAEHFKSASASPVVADQQKSEDPSFLIHLLFALMVYGLIFFTAIPMTRNIIYIINACLTFVSALLYGTALIFGRRNSTLAFCAVASIPLPGVLFAGYYFTVLDDVLRINWIYGLIAVPAAFLILGIVFLRNRAKAKAETETAETESKTKVEK